ncbi:hypothetical protein AVEN_119685-1 [Araneus ventricosus]|uniref:Uncharacterized protein n=1 Tax=Araneus ventricosus TaxID=182803 RepID=A0A4Y2NDV3_ARAVE|nr:hypothetical protein AVEN_119685-1 [Araneus ventricosus]
MTIPILLAKLKNCCENSSEKSGATPKSPYSAPNMGSTHLFGTRFSSESDPRYAYANRLFLCSSVSSAFLSERCASTCIRYFLFVWFLSALLFYVVPLLLNGLFLFVCFFGSSLLTTLSRTQKSFLLCSSVGSSHQPRCAITLPISYFFGVCFFGSSLTSVVIPNCLDHFISAPFVCFFGSSLLAVDTLLPVDISLFNCCFVRLLICTLLPLLPIDISLVFPDPSSWPVVPLLPIGYFLFVCFFGSSLLATLSHYCQSAISLFFCFFGSSHLATLLPLLPIGCSLFVCFFGSSLLATLSLLPIGYFFCSSVSSALLIWPRCCHYCQSAITWFFCFISALLSVRCVIVD